jgi:hypothetical protein
MEKAYRDQPLPSILEDRGRWHFSGDPELGDMTFCALIYHFWQVKFFRTEWRFLI